MFDVMFSPRAERDLNLFIDRYEDVFIELFADSGLSAVEKILQQYNEAAKSLHRRLTREIVAHLSSDLVLGRKRLPKRHALQFYVGRRLLIVSFSEEKKTKTRFVESIRINRKSLSL